MGGGARHILFKFPVLKAAVNNFILCLFLAWSVLWLFLFWIRLGSGEKSMQAFLTPFSVGCSATNLIHFFRHISFFLVKLPVLLYGSGHKYYGIMCMCVRCYKHLNTLSNTLDCRLWVPSCMLCHKDSKHIRWGMCMWGFIKIIGITPDKTEDKTMYMQILLLFMCKIRHLSSVGHVILV